MEPHGGYVIENFTVFINTFALTAVNRTAVCYKRTVTAFKYDRLAVKIVKINVFNKRIFIGM